jgi:hypothetical protein
MPYRDRERQLAYMRDYSRARERRLRSDRVLRAAVAEAILALAASEPKQALQILTKALDDTRGE